MTTSAPLFEGDKPVPARISLIESSGPVSPAYQYDLTITLTAGADGLRLAVEHEADFSKNPPGTDVHDKRSPSREAYEKIWAALLPLDPFSTPSATIDPERVGVSFNTLEIQLGQRSVKVDYTLNQLKLPEHARLAALVEAVKKALL